MALITNFNKFFSIRRSFFTNNTNFFLTEKKIFLPDHQFYHKWALLTDPDDITGGAKVRFDLTWLDQDIHIYNNIMIIIIMFMLLCIVLTRQNIFQEYWLGFYFFRVIWSVTFQLSQRWGLFKECPTGFSENITLM